MFFMRSHPYFDTVGILYFGKISTELCRLPKRPPGKPVNLKKKKTKLLICIVLKENCLDNPGCVSKRESQKRIFIGF